ncbi:494_t:CDS:2 [Dentiscutata erythropus]|uniref:494_t:CDS:1 n=1 Tax=Dentiscutata erythropus TaxID=1348616 RepID=A0A9N9ITR0_9GLOM|nr:494_t:CDS:2 [Dentiscutata erythropus]
MKTHKLLVLGMEGVGKTELTIQDSVQVPIIIVGNGCEKTTEREVSLEEGEDLAKKLNCEFFETSSKQSINVCRAFYSLVRMIRQVDGVCKKTRKKRRTFRYLFRKVFWLMSDLVYFSDK